MTSGRSIHARPILEEDLHAFVDQILDPARHAEVQVYLDAHAEVEARIAGYVRERGALRAALAPVAAEPIPPQLNLRHLAEARRSSWSMPWRSAAAAAVLLAIGGAAGWSLHRPTPDIMAAGGIASLAQEAAYTYGVYGADQAHPVEFKAADRAQLVDWISGRLQRSISVPELSSAGYRFMGGRLVATPHGPAGLLMYDNGQGLRLAMLVRLMETDKDASMLEHSDGSVQGYAWSDKGVGYSLVGPTSTNVLHPLANEIRRQVKENI
jgi:anti-sigma factor RsiW